MDIPCCPCFLFKRAKTRVLLFQCQVRDLQTPETKIAFLRYYDKSRLHLEVVGFPFPVHLSVVPFACRRVCSSMEFPRLSPPAINIHDVNSGYEQPRLIDRRLHFSPSSQPFSSPGPMPIPTKSISNIAPPPLPPPSHIADLANGHDAGWLHANSYEPVASRKLAPISPSSSLFGVSHHRRPEASAQGDPMMLDDLDGRQNRLPPPRSPEAQIRVEPPPPVDDGFQNSAGIINGPSSM